MSLFQSVNYISQKPLEFASLFFQNVKTIKNKTTEYLRSFLISRYKSRDAKYEKFN